MPLDQFHDTLADDLSFRVAEDGYRVPTVELTFPSDSDDRTSLTQTETIVLNDISLSVGCIELHIAYKLRHGTQRDFEDVLYLNHLLDSMLNLPKLEGYVHERDIETEYEQRRDA